MALLEIRATKKVTITCSLEESTAILVDQYAAFLKVPADDVVNQALAYVFSRDKEFQQYREKHADVKASPSLRVKKPVPTVAKGRAGSKQPLSIAQ